MSLVLADHVKKTDPKNLRLFYVALTDGTFQEVHAGCFTLTSDLMWTFYSEPEVKKVYDGKSLKTQGSILHVVKQARVQGIYDSRYVTLEAMVEKNTSRTQKTELRKKSAKSPSKQAEASK